MDNKGSIILYTTPDGDSKIEVTLQNETVWLTLDQMAELFQRNKSTISRHIKNVFEEGELQADSTVAFFATVQTEGKRKVERDIAYYNLDMIISVGYRVNSYRGVQSAPKGQQTFSPGYHPGYNSMEEFALKGQKHIIPSIYHRITCNSSIL